MTKISKLSAIVRGGKEPSAVIGVDVVDSSMVLHFIASCSTASVEWCHVPGWSCNFVRSRQRICTSEYEVTGLQPGVMLACIACNYHVKHKHRAHYGRWHILIAVVRYRGMEYWSECRIHITYLMSFLHCTGSSYYGVLMHLATSPRALCRNVADLFRMKRTRLESTYLCFMLIPAWFFLSPRPQTSPFFPCNFFHAGTDYPRTSVLKPLPIHIDRRIDSPVADEGYQCYLHSNGVHSCMTNQ